MQVAMRSKPGWFHAYGDPIGTIRSWDGRAWASAPYVVPRGWLRNYIPEFGQVLAGPMARAMASFVDAVLLLPVFAFHPGGATVGRWPFPVDAPSALSVPQLLPMILTLLLHAAYTVGFVVRRGATPGKAFLNCRVISARDGGSVGWRAAFLRWSPNLLMAMPFHGDVMFLSIAAISVVLAFATPRRQTLGDRLAATYVVRTK